MILLDTVPYIFKITEMVFNIVKFSPSQLVWLVVFVATVLLGVDLGLIVGLSFSLMIVIVRVAL